MKRTLRPHKLPVVRLTLRELSRPELSEATGGRRKEDCPGGSTIPHDC